MAGKGKIRCHECLYSADGIYNACYTCNYASLTGHCRTKEVRRKGPDGSWRTVRTVETPEECSYFAPRRGNQRKKIVREAKKPRTGRRRMAPDWPEKAMAMWKAGAFDAEIAAEVGCTQGNISHWRKKHGLKNNRARGSWSRKAYDWALARRIYDRGGRTTEICQAVGCSDSAARDWMDREGLERPRKGNGNVS